MNFEDTPSNNFYEILDVSPDSSAQEIREAYLKAKLTYTKDSLALYTLITPAEREEMLRSIEEAFQTLSNEEKRRAYDQCHGHINSVEPNAAFDFFSESTKVQPGSEAPEVLESRSREGKKIDSEITSIDRTAPMEPSPQEVLVAPAVKVVDVPLSTAPILSQPTTSSPPLEANTPELKLPGDFEGAIQAEKEWPGEFLRKVREFRNVSLEEISSATKISKNYLMAIEAEDYKKLPAAVFVRGFITQISRLLRIPGENVAVPYMIRFKKARGSG